MNPKTGIKKLFKLLLAVTMVGVTVLCAALRVAESRISPPINLLAAEMTLPAADFNDVPHDSTSAVTSRPESTSVSQESTPVPDSTSSPDAESDAVPAASSPKKNPAVQSSVPADHEASEFEVSVPSDEEIARYDELHEGEAQYPVYTFTATEGNISYKNVQVKNNSSTDIDIKQELEAELGFTIKESSEPQVLIYHTHTSESFLTYDTGYFYESFYPRTTDSSQNVCAVGDEIAGQLNASGIVTLHDKTLHDYPSYNGAYDRSFATVSEYLKKYPSIKVVLDIHRDGIGSDSQKSKPVFTYNGIQGAQIMILAGYNYDGSEEFKDWEYNLRFALQIQNTASQMYPDMVRPLNFADFMYNMNINTGSLLIEMGAESNTLEEVRYSGYLLGKVLSKVLHDNAA